MTDLDRVLVLAGGISPEREVSLRSGRRLQEALVRIGVDAEVRDADADLIDALTDDAPAVVFPVLHGVSGEDGTVREVLDLLGVPYVGATPDACRVAFDKPTAKAAVAAAGLSTPASVTLPKEAFHDLGAGQLIARIVQRLGLAVVVKPRAGGSAFGVSYVAAAADLPAALMTCVGYHDWALIERAVTGVEVAVGVIDTADGPVALPAVEIMPASGVYDYAARYTAGETRFVVPARLDPRAAAAAADAALTAHRVLGLRDLSRTDLIVDHAGTVWYLETNIAPGLTETSTWPMGLAGAGLDFAVACRDLAAHAMTRAGR
ncbi:D-alanine--D-alanine ligase [Frankia sp. QA3]|uniref:D-alanine--D-alanine ligase family protein n=1 Tax=Frankia sp. QA3 TaxID=710111 RepID=UPI000269C146|nr:D-alanine--D-alanine ligase [Frankia sp. QA3]EIV91622.1 ATP-grasp enzyme, D-alanine-D-alanine ligase [Frankia sp. QA3]